MEAGAQVKVLCKPEQLRLNPNGALRGQLAAVAYLGSVVQYQVDFGNQSLEVVSAADDDALPAVGSEIRLDVRPEQLRLIEA